MTTFAKTTFSIQRRSLELGEVLERFIRHNCAEKFCGSHYKFRLGLEARNELISVDASHMLQLTSPFLLGLHCGYSCTGCSTIFNPLSVGRIAVTISSLVYRVALLYSDTIVQ